MHAYTIFAFHSDEGTLNSEGKQDVINDDIKCRFLANYHARRKV